VSNGAAKPKALSGTPNRQDGKVLVDSEYDLFEILPNHSVEWRACVRGTKHALEQLMVLGQQTPNECFATGVLSRMVLGRVNQQSAGIAND
jgi:hypothetical protein